MHRCRSADEQVCLTSYLSHVLFVICYNPSFVIHSLFAFVELREYVGRFVDFAGFSVFV